jgi:hypothetical protein
METPGEECEERSIIADLGIIETKIVKPEQNSNTTRNFSTWFNVN